MDKTFAEGNIWKQESYRSLDFSTFTVEVRVNMNIMHFLSPETAFPLASDITGLKHHTFTGLRANKEGSFNIQIYKDLVFFLILVSQFHQHHLLLEVRRGTCLVLGQLLRRGLISSWSFVA